MTTWKLEQGDIIEWAKGYQGAKFHSLLTDAPYHLTSITKRFGKEGSAPAKGDVYRRASAGFMGSRWDGGGISFDPETWAALAEHLYPGAFGMTFASPRTHHRIACAIEDAGMIIQPTFYCWVYLSGFPKATRIKGEGDFAGHRYGGQCIKPSVEPVIIFQKPYEGRPVDSIVATGAGALNIDAGRIAAPEGITSGGAPNGHNNPCFMSKDIDPRIERTPEHTAGRWPANFLLQHSPLDNGDCHPDCPVRLFDEQAGETGQQMAGGYTPKAPKFNGRTYQNGEIYEGDKRESREPLDAPGPASRMFHRSSWQYEVAEQLANAEPVRYEPKVSSSEREAGLDGQEARPLTEQDKWAAKDRWTGTDRNPTEWTKSPVRNNHPTLKPISLTKYLATLLLPPAAYAPRRILIPFAGVGSEMAGALLAGWEDVIGIEREANYVKIAQARLAWWSQWPGWGQTDVDAILAAAKVDDVGQMSLFDDAA